MKILLMGILFFLASCSSFSNLFNQKTIIVGKKSNEKYKISSDVSECYEKITKKIDNKILAQLAYFPESELWNTDNINDIPMTKRMELLNIYEQNRTKVLGKEAPSLVTPMKTTSELSEEFAANYVKNIWQGEVSSFADEIRNSLNETVCEKIYQGNKLNDSEQRIDIYGFPVSSPLDEYLVYAAEKLAKPYLIAVASTAQQREEDLTAQKKVQEDKQEAADNAVNALYAKIMKEYGGYSSVKKQEIKKEYGCNSQTIAKIQGKLSQIDIIANHSTNMSISFTSSQTFKYGTLTPSESLSMPFPANGTGTYVFWFEFFSFAPNPEVNVDVVDSDGNVMPYSDFVGGGTRRYRLGDDVYTIKSTTGLGCYGISAMKLHQYN